MLTQSFDCQPTLRGTTLTLRALRQSDLEGMFGAASDPEIWTGHPAKDRYKREVFEPYFAFLLSTQTALTVIDIHSGEIVGTSSYYTPPDLPNSIAIGFTFLIRAKWGGAANRELKQLMVKHAFTAFDIVYFHVAPTNIRSQTAMLKLGAAHMYDAVLKVSTTPQEAKCFGLTKTQWAQSMAALNARPNS